MKEKAFATPGFVVKDITTKRDIFSVQNSGDNQSACMKIVDREGNEIVSIKEKKVTLHKRTYILDKKGLVRVVVRKSHHFQVSTEAEAWILKNPVPLKNISKEETKSRPADFIMGGVWKGNKRFLFVKKPDKIFAKAEKIDGIDSLINRTDYLIEIHANIDTVFVVSLALCVDLMYKDA